MKKYIYVKSVPEDKRFPNIVKYYRSIHEDVAARSILTPNNEFRFEYGFDILDIWHPFILFLGDTGRYINATAKDAYKFSDFVIQHYDEANDFYYQLFLDLMYVYSHQQEFGNALEGDVLAMMGDDEK